MSDSEKVPGKKAPVKRAPGNKATGGKAPVKRTASAAATSEKVSVEKVVVRRSPRYLRFATLGAIVGILVALILTLSWPENPEYTQLQVFGFIALITIVVFGTIGLVVALLLDRYFARRTATVTAERVTVAETPKK